jgi:hypothetical protein
LLKKSITYTNPFTDQQVTEEHYFHISKADMVEMEMEEHSAKYVAKDGKELTGMQAKLQKIIDSQDGKAIIAELKDLIHRAYGKKVGESFVKTDAVWQEFAGSEAYSQLIFELCTDAEVAGQFMSGIIPNNLDQEAARLQAKAQQTAPTIEAVEKLAEATGAELPQEPSTPEEAREHLSVVSRENQPSEPRVLTQDEVIAMDGEELKLGLANGKYKLS